MNKRQLIVEDLKNTKIPQKQLASKYKVSVSYISKINHGVYEVEGYEGNFPIRPAGYRQSTENNSGVAGVYFEDIDRWYIFCALNPSQKFDELKTKAFSKNKKTDNKFFMALRKFRNHEFVLLETCDSSKFIERMQYWINEKGGLNKTLNLNPHHGSVSISVFKFDLEGELVEIFDSIKEASEREGVSNYNLTSAYKTNKYIYIRADLFEIEKLR